MFIMQPDNFYGKSNLLHKLYQSAVWIRTPYTSWKQVETLSK